MLSEEQPYFEQDSMPMDALADYNAYSNIEPNIEPIEFEVRIEALHPFSVNMSVETSILRTLHISPSLRKYQRNPKQ